MPELPEVQTTVNGLARTIVGLKIASVWTDYNSPYFRGSGTIKDPRYFKSFKRAVMGRKVASVGRRAKNILINLDDGSIILVHMKMTGHLMYGTYERARRSSNHYQAGTTGKIKNHTARNQPEWIPIKPESLKDPFNRYVHFMITFGNGKRLALSDSRKFAKVTLIKDGDRHVSEHLKDIGPEPLEKGFTFEKFEECLGFRPRGKVKQVLMDQSVIAGVGNIYADESLWRAGIHPLEQVEDIPPAKMRRLFDAIKQTLSKGIDFGGDSMSDYRNIHGEKGRFQEHHRAYRKTGTRCGRPGCGGTIRRVMVGARSAHYCDRHQRRR